MDDCHAPLEFAFPFLGNAGNYKRNGWFDFEGALQRLVSVRGVTQRELKSLSMRFVLMGGGTISILCREFTCQHVVQRFDFPNCFSQHLCALEQTSLAKP